MITNELELGNIENILFTHTHHDHFHPDDLTMRSPVFFHNITYPLNIYGNDVVISKCRDTIQFSKDSFKYHHVKPFVSIQVGDFNVTPIVSGS